MTPSLFLYLQTHAAAGPEIELYRNSASPADNDAVGQIQFRGNNDASQEVGYAEIDCFIRDVSDGTEDGELRVLVTRNGTAREALSLSGGDVAFNEAGEDVNFRVESDGNTGMLFVDGGNNRVGIGTNSPSVELEISGASGNAPSAIYRHKQSTHLRAWL